MKSQRGVTLTSVVIYVVAMTIIIAIVATVTSFFYSNANDMADSEANLGEFNQFNVAFLQEVKKEGNSVKKVTENQIFFQSGTVFTFQDNGIYQDKIKICTGVTNCKFKVSKQEEKTMITVLLEIGTKVPFVKTIEYTMPGERIPTTVDIEAN